MRKCNFCNKDIKDDQFYCNYCGNKLEIIIENNDYEIKTIKKNKLNIKERIVDFITKEKWFILIIIVLLLIFVLQQIKIFKSDYTPLENLTYSIIDEDSIAIVSKNKKSSYNGTKDYIKIAPYYEINNKKYNVEIIGEYAFANTNTITDIELPETITTIKDNAFLNNTSITKITIPENVTFIGNNAFGACNNLNTIIFNAHNCNDLSVSCNTFKNVGQYNEGVTIVIGKNVERLPAYLFSSEHSYDNIKIKKIIFSDNYCYEIGEGCFKHSDIDNFKIPNSIINIGKEIFKNSTIKKIELSSEIKFVPDYAFYGCKNLEEIKLSNSIEIIGVRSFNNSGLKTITISENIKSIEHSAFENSELESIIYNGNEKSWKNIVKTNNNFENINIQYGGKTSE